MKKKPHEHTPEGFAEYCACGAIRRQGEAWEVPAARQLVERYLAQSTPEERSRVATKRAAKRFKGWSDRKLSEYMSQIARQPRPSRLSPDRCPCGLYTKYKAAKLKHQCKAVA